MDIDKIQTSKLDEITTSQQKQTDKPKDGNKFQQEMGRDALGVQGDARNVIIKKSILEPTSSTPNNTEEKIILTNSYPDGSKKTVTQKTFSPQDKTGISKTTFSVKHMDRIAIAIGIQIKSENGKTEQYARIPTPLPIKFIDDNGVEHKMFPKGVSGEFNIYSIAPPNNEPNLIGLAETDENGGVHVEKNLKSLDGTQTNTVYADDANGNRIIYYEIAEPNGNKFIKKETFKKIDENHFTSKTSIEIIENGRKNSKIASYDIQINNNKVIVTKENNPKEKIEYQIQDIPDTLEEDLDIISDEVMTELISQKRIADPDTLTKEEATQIINIAINRYNKNKNVLDKKILPILSQISGAEWDAMFKSNTKAVFVSEAMNSSSLGDVIFISPKHNDKLNVFSHELGHQKFDTLNLKNDKELIKIYNEELKAYTTVFPKAATKEMDYFILGSKKESTKERAINELGAESNLITNTYQSLENIQARTTLAQQFFPKTIAYIQKRFAELIT